MNLLNQYMAARLADRAQAGNLRHLTTRMAPTDFFSNDYLGLATSGLPGKGINNHLPYSTGSTGSRLLSGNSELAETLEQLIASHHGAEAALLFNSGYDANAGLLACIAPRHATILYDELCHASITDGIRLSICSRKYKFAHNDLERLEQKLKKFAPLGPVIVVAESVYSMDGDMAPLVAMAALCTVYNAQLVVDEAHATGIYGPHGQGLVYELGLQHSVFARIHTFGKALGCHGAAVAGSALLRHYLINYARTFIYTTALPRHSLQCIAEAYRYMSSPGFSHAPLHDLIHYFRQKIAAYGRPGWLESHSPIQALVAGGNDNARQLALRLQQAGIQVSPILHPTVPAGKERLRICLHTFNTRDEVDGLFEQMG